MKNNINVTRKLSQSPSVANINHHQASDIEQLNDDDQPQKPTIDGDPREGDFMLPILADKHKALHNKKGSVVVTSNNKFLNENDSQNSNSYGNLPKADLAPNKL